MTSNNPEPLELGELLASEVDALLAEGRRYQAIRLVRKRTGAGLVVGTRAVDHRDHLRGR